MRRLKDLKRFVALKIKVNFYTGERAGGIDPRDPNLVCYGWQNIDDGWEIRLIADESKIDEYVQKYGNAEGVEVIEGIENIDKAIDEIIPPEKQYRHIVCMPELLLAGLIARHLDRNDDFDIRAIPVDSTKHKSPEDERKAILQHLASKGFKGIRTEKVVYKLSEFLNML